MPRRFRQANATAFTNIPAIYNGAFWIVIAWSVWGPIMGGLSAASMAAIGMDVLPADENGRPTNAGRDSSLASLNGIVPGAILPSILGHYITTFPNHQKGFAFMFAIGGVINVLQNLMLYGCVHPLNEPLDKPCQCTRSYFKGRKEHDFKKRRQLAERARAVGLPETASEYEIVTAEERGAPGGASLQQSPAAAGAGIEEQLMAQYRNSGGYSSGNYGGGYRGYGVGGTRRQTSTRSV